MRIGLVELLLILLIASLTVGPSAALWVDRWMRRAQKTSAAAARRRAAQEAQRAAEREEVLQRFQKLSIVFVLCAAVALIWGLVLRPIEADADRKLLSDAVGMLSQRERDIITMRFGLWGQKELTQKEVADRLGISQSYISRLEKRIILRLRREIVKMS